MPRKRPPGVVELSSDEYEESEHEDVQCSQQPSSELYRTYSVDEHDSDVSIIYFIFTLLSFCCNHFNSDPSSPIFNCFITNFSFFFLIQSSPSSDNSDFNHALFELIMRDVRYVPTFCMSNIILLLTFLQFKLLKKLKRELSMSTKHKVINAFLHQLLFTYK